MPNIYQNGVGGTLGAQLATVKPLWMSGAVWYVRAGGVDAAAPAGKSREYPLATIAQAVTNAADGDIICLMDGHLETIAVEQAVAKKLCFIGEGSSGGQPTVQLTLNASATNMFSVTTSFVEFHNIKFRQSTAANAGARIACAATDMVVDGCYFECGNLDNVAISFAGSADRCRIRNTTVISVAETAPRPVAGITTIGALADLELDGLVLSAGTIGFSNYFALDASAGAITRLRGINCSLLLGADVKLHASTTGRLNVGTCTGGSRVEW